MKVRTVDFDRLATSAPIDKQAAIDYAATGEGPSLRTSGGHVLDGPPAMRRFAPLHAGMVDLTGRSFGSLTVLGLKAKEATDGKWAGARWVCRCVCGNYTIRRHEKLVKKAPDADERCPQCDQQRRVLNRPSANKIDRRLRAIINAARGAGA